MASPREQLVKQTKRFQANLVDMDKVAKAADSGELTGVEIEQLSSAYKGAMSARVACHCIISSRIKETGGNDHDFSTDIDPGLSTIASLLLKILLTRQLPPSSVMNSRLAEVKTGTEHEQAVKDALITFKASEAIVNRGLAPSNIRLLELALRFSAFYFKILKSPDAARSIAMQAVDKAMPEWNAITEEKHEMAALNKAEDELDTPKKRKQFLTYLQLLCHSVTFWTSMIQDDGVTETKKQENNGAESSVIEEAAPIKKRKLTAGFDCGFENQSMETLCVWLVQHAKYYKQMVAMMEKIATAADSGSLTLEERCLMKCVSLNAINARIGYGFIISYIKEQKNDDCLTEIDVGKVLLKVLDSGEIPYAEGMDRKEAVENILSIFKDAQDIARQDWGSSNPERLGLAINYSDLYFQILNDADGGCKIAKQAVEEAEQALKDELRELAIGGLDTDKCRVAMGVLRLNMTHWRSIMQGDIQGPSSTRTTMRGKKEEKKQEEEENGAESRMPSMDWSTVAGQEEDKQ